MASGDRDQAQTASDKNSQESNTADQSASAPQMEVDSVAGTETGHVPAPVAIGASGSFSGSNSDFEDEEIEGDDEATLEEEELAAAEDSGGDDELAALQMEQDLPIEELLKLYGGATAEMSEPQPSTSKEIGGSEKHAAEIPGEPASDEKQAEPMRSTRSTNQYLRLIPPNAHTSGAVKPGSGMAGTNEIAQLNHDRGGLALLAAFRDDNLMLGEEDDENDEDYVPPPPKVQPTSRVGEEYQARVAEWREPLSKFESDPSPSCATPMWLPQPILDTKGGPGAAEENPKVLEYLRAVGESRGLKQPSCSNYVDDADALYCYFQCDYKPQKALASYTRYRTSLLQRCTERMEQMVQAAGSSGSQDSGQGVSGSNANDLDTPNVQNGTGAGDKNGHSQNLSDLNCMKELRKVAAMWDMVKAHGDNPVPCDLSQIQRKFFKKAKKRNGIFADQRVDACACRSWPFSEIESDLFEQALVYAEGKFFHKIAQEQMHGLRTSADLVAYYYMWKKSERHDKFMQNHSKVLKRQTHCPDVCDYVLEHLDFIASASRMQQPHYTSIGREPSQVSNSDTNATTGINSVLDKQSTGENECKIVSVGGKGVDN